MCIFNVTNRITGGVFSQLKLAVLSGLFLFEEVLRPYLEKHVYYVDMGVKLH